LDYERERQGLHFLVFFNAIVNSITLYATQFALSVVEGGYTVIYHCLE